jgi:hypothetical protein
LSLPWYALALASSSLAFLQRDREEARHPRRHKQDRGAAIRNEATRNGSSDGHVSQAAPFRTQGGYQIVNELK